MANTPVHVQMFRLIKHITETPLSFTLPVSSKSKRALVGRQRKLARRRRKTQQLLQGVSEGWKTTQQTEDPWGKDGEDPK